MGGDTRTGSIPVCGIIFFSEIFVKSMFTRISEFFVLCIPFGGKDIIKNNGIASHLTRYNAVILKSSHFY